MCSAVENIQYGGGISPILRRDIFNRVEGIKYDGKISSVRCRVIFSYGGGIYLVRFKDTMATVEGYHHHQLDSNMIRMLTVAVIVSICRAFSVSS